ncbi:MAG TPA: hypothetical protein DCZ38_04655 [Coxiellaceae bacterium]|nr:MAG: hypothetical protein A2V89_00080 [Gammaproteobacteria bacterium RBG_16_37_9]HBC72045.1 hypothetical protein [Coxiellaceae bacterium]
MRILVLVTFLWTIILTPAQAKWATPADAPTKNSYIKEINVNNNGTYEMTVETKKEILTELGRDVAANTTLYYNGDSEKLEILAAKTIYKGKEYPLDKNLIEDKPLASSPSGFDQVRQILLAFPKAEVGATLYLKYKFIQKIPNLDDFFAETFSFGRGELVVSSRVKINSKLPLNTLINDPKNFLKITKNKTNNLYNLEVVLAKPIFTWVINEPELIINDKYFTWVSVSNLNKWEDLAVKQGLLYTKVFSQKLPENFEQILKIAKKKTNEVEQINTVTSLLNDKIRYLGDWRTVNGRFIPRDLDKISKTQLGDCKDFSAATAAILTKLGFKAQIVLVMRGIDSLSKNILPSLEAFNHAMVKVTNKNGLVYWIDPTNFVSMANGIFPDIANKMALILDPKEPSYEKIPSVNFMRAEAGIVKRQMVILSDGKILESGHVILKNEATIGITGAALRFSNEIIKNIIFYAFAGEVNIDDKNKKSMHLPKLDSRIVSDISFDYSFERENDILKTNVGPAIKLIYGGPISKLYSISQDYGSEALIDTFPNTDKRQTIIKNINAQNIESLNKEIKTPWLYVKRECSFNHNHDLQIDDTTTVYKNLIPNEDFKKPEFIKLKNWLKDNFKDVVIVFEPKTKKN